MWLVPLLCFGKNLFVDVRAGEGMIGEIRIEKKNNSVKKVYNQIDYILIHRNKKQNIRNARTYAGTETSSDHKLLVLEFESDWVKMYRKINKKKEVTQKRFDTRKLIIDQKVRDEYQSKLRSEAERANTWDELSEACKKSAEEVIGYVQKNENGSVDDEEIKEMSIRQKKRESRS